MTQVKKDLTMANSAATGTILLSLDPQDFDIVKRSGPLVADFGGNFVSQTDTITLASNPQTITTYQLTVSHKFAESGKDAAYNELVAKDWMDDVEAKIATALGDIRVDDAALVGGLPTYSTI